MSTFWGISPDRYYEITDDNDETDEETNDNESRLSVLPLEDRLKWVDDNSDVDSNINGEQPSRPPTKHKTSSKKLEYNRTRHGELKRLADIGKQYERGELTGSLTVEIDGDTKTYSSEQAVRMIKLCLLFGDVIDHLKHYMKEDEQRELNNIVNTIYYDK
jgi:hypothetical protein